MKIPIKSHTKVRRPESKYRIAIWGDNHSSQTIHNTRLVKDIYIGLDDPLILLPGMHNSWEKAMNAQETINQIYNEMQSDFLDAIQNPKITSTYPERVPGTRPSILTRVKERFKR